MAADNNVITREQWKEIFNNIDLLQAVELSVTDIEMHMGLDGELIVHISTTGTPDIKLTNDAKQFKVTPDGVSMSLTGHKPSNPFYK